MNDIIELIENEDSLGVLLFLEKTRNLIGSLPSLDGYSVLEYLVLENKIHIATLVASKYQALINPEDKRTPPLHLALQLGNSRAVDMLLSAGANPNVTNVDGDTALHVAVTWNRSQHIGALLRMGAKVNTPNKRLWTPLHMAARYDHSQNAEILIEHNADVTLQNDKDHTALDIAYMYGCGPIATLLINHGAQMGVRNV